MTAAIAVSCVYGMNMPTPLRALRMKCRADFLRAQRGVRRRSAGLMLEVCHSPAEKAPDGVFRVGFTASKKVGNSVARSRAKRRLRALAAEILPAMALPGTDYVLIAKTTTLVRPFAELRDDLVFSVKKAHQKLEPQPSAPVPDGVEGCG